MLLGAEEKRLQLEELARIVTGIRLFNREQGKGGAGLDHVEDAVADDGLGLEGGPRRRGRRAARGLHAATRRH